MRFHLFTALVLVALASYVHCGCDEQSSDDGEVTVFFKNLGCDIKKGADKISDSAKPWVDEIGRSAKKFGGTVADTFTDLKDKITGSADNTTAATTTTTTSTNITSESSATPTEAATPSSIEDRILLSVDPKCPSGQRMDERGHCRPFA